ncbi:uroporphyrinogen-III synthase [Actinomyces sp.]|uniref:uroporphyrinogen-III synthase n=1 Tax=Actinomyces sp. TaxID=29317 RepID=UPI0026DDA231|nr:uroporphyrinogen-III synthase [Actinomyces sp.]MDO4900109.1 uroporphyrinogen-III synthase [Actinomyces sp.]
MNRSSAAEQAPQAHLPASATGVQSPAQITAGFGTPGIDPSTGDTACRTDSAGARLIGRRVLLPRTRPDDTIAAALAAAGAEVVCVGVTRAVEGPAAPRERAAADLAASGYAWVVITSARTLDFFDFGGLHASAPLRARVAVVGAGTARAVRERLGREPDLVAAGSGAALLELPQLGQGPDSEAGAAHRRLLLPGSALSRPALREGLAGVGWEVDAVAAYTMEPTPIGELPAGFTRQWAGGRFDAAVLVAGSSTRALVDVAGPPPPTTRLVAIGRPTAAAAGTMGLHVDAVAYSPTPTGVRDAVITAFTAGHSSQPYSQS